MNMDVVYYETIIVVGGGAAGLYRACSLDGALSLLPVLEKKSKGRKKTLT